MSSFTPNFSSKTTDLRNLLRNYVTFEWSSLYNNHFRILKESLYQCVNLAYFDANKPTIIQVDAPFSAATSVKKLSSGGALLFSHLLL